MTVVSHLEHVIKVCFVKKSTKQMTYVLCLLLAIFHAILFALLCVCVWAPGGIKILQTDQTKIKLLFQAQLPPSQRLFLKRRYFYEPDAFELYLSFFRYNKCVFSTWLMERQESVLHLRELR